MYACGLLNSKSNKMSNRKIDLKPRNPFHDHPLMRKGGTHEKTNKAKRKGEKQALRKEWRSLLTLPPMYSENAALSPSAAL